MASRARRADAGGRGTLDASSTTPSTPRPARSCSRPPSPTRTSALWPGAVRRRDGHRWARSRTASSCPAAAVQTGQQGQYVFVVKRRPDGRAAAGAGRPAWTSDEAVIAEGLAAGETVVTDGQLRLVPGAAIEVKEPARPRGDASHEHLRALHPPAGHDHARHGRASCSSASWPTGCCRSATCRTWTSRPSRSSAVAARAPARRRWPRRWRRRSRRQFSTIAGIDSMTSSSSLGHAPRSRSSSPSTATSTPPPRTCRRPSPAPAGSCRRTCRTPPSYQKVNPADQPILFLALTSPTLPLSALDEYGRDHDRPAHLDGQRAWPRCRSTARRSTPCASSSTRARWPRRGIGIDEVVARRPGRPTSTCRPASCTARTRPSPIQADRPAHRRRGLPAARSSPTATARRSASSELGTRRRQRRERQDRRLVHRPARRSSWRSSASPAPTPSRSRDAVKALLPTFRAQLPASRVDCTSCSTARESIHESVNDVKFTLLPHPGPGRAGDLPLPAQPLGHRHPAPGAADVDRRHLRRHVPARLQPRQPVADGADAVGRLRRRRRHRHAREHRPPHGDGQDAARRRRSTARARSASPSSR